MQSSYHARSVNTNPKHRQPIPGGSVSIRPLFLLMTSAACRLRLIDCLALFHIQCRPFARRPAGATRFHSRRQIRRALNAPSRSARAGLDARWNLKLAGNTAAGDKLTDAANRPMQGASHDPK